jgi:hypothetical protein
MSTVVRYTTTFPPFPRASLLRQRVVIHPDHGEEAWRDVPGFRGCYRVSSRGRVHSLTRRARFKDGHTQAVRGKLLRPKTDRGGYRRVVLWKDGVGTTCKVHHVVLLAFVGPRPPGTECRHLDGDPANNGWRNLAWGSHKENTADAIAHGTFAPGGENGNALLRDADIPAIHAEYAAGSTPQEIGRRRGVSAHVIRGVLYKETYHRAQPATPAVKRAPKGIRGEAHHSARLTEDAVREVRRLWATGRYTQCLLARRYGVCQATIKAIVLRHTWKHV